MFWYINTFFIENVSTCRYKYILKVSDTYTVSDTKGLLYTVLFYLEQIMKHEMMIRFRMAPWQIDIFIHVEGLDVLETDFSGLEIFHKLGIHFQRSSSSWQTFKNEKLMNWISYMQKLEKKSYPKQSTCLCLAWIRWCAWRHIWRPTHQLWYRRPKWQASFSI